MAGAVSWISIAPVKGMRIQAREAVRVGPDGVPGDRAFILVESNGAMVNGKRHGGLMEIIPAHDPEAGMLRLDFPDGHSIEAEVESGEPEPITFFGEPAAARAVAGPFSEAISSHVGADVRLMLRPEGRAGTDRGKWGGVSLLGEASLESLRASGRDFNCSQPAGDRDAPDPGPIDPRRFRMTFGIEGTAPYEEDEWVTREIMVGPVRVRIGGHTGRCAVTTREPETGTTDLKTLHFLRHSRNEVDSLEPLPFGIYGQVLEPGEVRLGDPVGLAD